MLVHVLLQLVSCLETTFPKPFVSRAPKRAELESQAQQEEEQAPVSHLLLLLDPPLTPTHATLEQECSHETSCLDSSVNNRLRLRHRRRVSRFDVCREPFLSLPLHYAVFQLWRWSRADTLLELRDLDPIAHPNPLLPCMFNFANMCCRSPRLLPTKATYTYPYALGEGVCIKEEGVLRESIHALRDKGETKM